MFRPIFKKNVKCVKNITNEHFTSPSLYTSGFWMIDMTSISGGNLLKIKIDMLEIKKKRLSSNQHKEVNL